MYFCTISDCHANQISNLFNHYIQWWKNGYKYQFKCLGRLGNTLTMLFAHCLNLPAQENRLLFKVRLKIQNHAIITENIEMKSKWFLSDYSWLLQATENGADNCSNMHISP